MRGTRVRDVSGPPLRPGDLDVGRLNSHLDLTALNPFPDQIALSARPVGGAESSLVMPAEAALARNWGEHRRAEFMTGRACAREVLSILGFPEHALLRQSSGEPSWPSGVRGSIAHTRSFAIAAAGLYPIEAIGVDVEEVRSVEETLFPTICTQRELEVIRRASAGEAADHVETIFTLKEAFYKAQFALTGEWLDFHDMETGQAGGTWGIGTINPRRRSHALAMTPVCRTLVHKDARWSLAVLRRPSDD